MQLFLPANSLAEIFIESEHKGEMNSAAQALPAAAPRAEGQPCGHAHPCLYTALLTPVVVSSSQPGQLQGMLKLCHRTADFAELQPRLGSFWPQGFNNNTRLESSAQHKVTSAPKPPPGCWAGAPVDVCISNLRQKSKARERSLCLMPVCSGVSSLGRC